jgi:hypothetical protein
VLPAFPFKDQNPFRTASSAAHWDIGEIALLIRLHCIALALNQIHPYDAEWLVVSDGTVYAQMFELKTDQASEYLQGLREQRNALNLQATVHFIDLKRVIDRTEQCFVLELLGETHRGLNRILDAVSRCYNDLYSTDDDVKGLFDGLARSMVWNLNTRTDVQRSGMSGLWRAMNEQCTRLSAADRALREQLSERARSVAIAYASFNVALGLCEFWPAVFPFGLRATVHGKPGQVAIPKLGRGDPWNAVGVLAPGLLGPRSVRTRPLWALSNDFRPIYLAGFSDPLGFAEKSQIEVLQG